MSNTTKTQHHERVNVIEDYDRSTQDPAYNEKFRNWREKKDNPYAFRFKADRREKVFNDSRGFEERSQEDDEKRIISRIMYILGIALLIYIVIDTIIGKLLALILGLIGFDIHINTFSSSMYGNVSSVVTTILLVSSAELIIPAVYLQLKLKTPMRVGFMSKVTSSAEILLAIAVTLIVCTVVCLPTAYSSDSKEIFSYFRNTETNVYEWGQTEFVFYTVFSIVLLPIMSEIFVHGPVFAALRQFGDPFAIVVTSAVSVLITRNIAEIPAALLISLTAGVFMLRSGTIMSAFIVSVIYRMYVFALIMLEGSSSANMLLRRNIFMLCAFIAGALIFGTIYITRKAKGKNRKCIVLYHSGITPVRRFCTAAKTFPFNAVAIVCVAEVLIKALFW